MKTKFTFLLLMIMNLSLYAQNIEFTFANTQKTNDGSFDYYEADVMIAAVEGQADFKLGIGQVYINYNPLAFGNSINTGGGLGITYPSGYILGQVNGFPYYSDFIINDNSLTRFSFAYQQGISSGSMVNNVTSTPAKLFHIKMKFISSGQLPMVTFEDNETQPPGVSNSRDQFFTACGPSTGGLALDNCATFPGMQFNNALFNNSGATLSSPEGETMQDISIYPNPASEYIYIVSNQNINKIELFDLLGKQVLITKETKQIKITHLPTGLYVLKVLSDKGTLTKKIVIE